MKKFRRIAAAVIFAALVISETAYAQSVILADRPFGEATANGTYQAAGTKNTASGTVANTEKSGTGSDVSQGPGASNNKAPESKGTTGSGSTGPGTATGTGVKQVVVDQKIAKPEISSEAAVLYDASTGQVLFEKNANQAMYPASTTKIMTALLAAENLPLTKEFTFTDSATKNLESGYTNVQMVTGDRMTTEDALYALMLKSACEVANGLAEAVSGNQTEFSALMNRKAQELGCRNTNFRNASGLNDTEHHTTAYDMALITAAAFRNQTVRKVCSTKSWTLPASIERGKLTVTNSNKMLTAGNAEYFEGVVGGKTGYTSKAGNTLCEFAEIGGHEIVSVVMKSTGKQYVDSKALLTYAKTLISATESTSDPGKKSGTWEQTSAGWKYKTAEGSYAKSEWVDIGENEYYFNAEGIMATGWKQFTNGAWYYFDPANGAMVHDKWVSTDQQHYYYLQSNGVMATNTVIGGKYRVDSTGVYVEKAGS